MLVQLVKKKTIVNVFLKKIIESKTIVNGDSFDAMKSWFITSNSSYLYYNTMPYWPAGVELDFGKIQNFLFWILFYVFYCVQVDVCANRMECAPCLRIPVRQKPWVWYYYYFRFYKEICQKLIIWDTKMWVYLPVDLSKLKV